MWKRKMSMKKLIFSVSVSGAVLLSFLPLAAQTAISSSGNVTGAAEGVNDVSATLKDTDGRRIVSATASGYRGKTGEVVNDAKAKTGDAQRSIPQYLSYTLILSGEIAPNKGGGEFAGEGGPETYSATRLERGAIYIEAEGYETSNITIPSGETAIFRLKNTTGENVFGDWNVSKDGGASQKKDGVKSITFNRSFWGDIISWFTSDGAVTALMPGVYSITATPENRTEPTAAGNLTVVGVDKIEVKIRDGNYKTPDAVTYVAVGDSFSVKAFSMPGSVVWPDGTPEWSASGDNWFSSVISGTGEEITVDTSREKDGFHITATCGTSEKRIAVKIYQCRFAVYVQSPLGGPVGIVGVFDKTLVVGHAFWELKVSDFAVDYLRNDELSQYSSFLNGKYGFYPDFEGFFENQTGNGLLQSDESHSYDKSKEYNISYSNLVAGLSGTKSLSVSPGTYTLGTRIIVNEISSGRSLVNFSSGSDRNCVTVCKSIASQAGISLPNTFITNWYTTMGDIELNYSGNCPYVLKNNL